MDRDDPLRILDGFRDAEGRSFRIVEPPTDADTLIVSPWFWNELVDAGIVNGKRVKVPYP